MILAIDPGTKCGWAVGHSDILNSGTWNLTAKRHESRGIRFLRLTRKLQEVFSIYQMALVAYEEVRMHEGVQAAHIYGGFEAVIQSFCIANEIEYVSVPVGTIKKHISGKGNANKASVINSVKKKLKVPVVDDNHADALALFDYARQEYL